MFTNTYMHKKTCMQTLFYFSCDGSFEVESTIETDISQGVHRGASKYVFELQYFVLLKYSFTSTYNFLESHKKTCFDLCGVTLVGYKCIRICRDIYVHHSAS